MTKNIATMTAAELAQHIDATERRHRKLMAALRALQRAREAEEEPNDDGKDGES